MLDVSDVKYLCNVDVQSMYTNIPYAEVHEAVKDQLCQDSTVSNQQISFLMLLLGFILTKNDFRFGQQLYLQLQMTLMGSLVAPSYTNIFMSMIETQKVLNSPFSRFIQTWM